MKMKGITNKKSKGIFGNNCIQYENDVIEKIIKSFNGSTKKEIPLLQPRKEHTHLTATIKENGLVVTNLGNTYNFLPWIVFVQAINCIEYNEGEARKGNAQGNLRLGDEGLTIDTIEGSIAHFVYGKEKGDTIFRRISAIAPILVWCDACVGERGVLKLKDS